MLARAKLASLGALVAQARTKGWRSSEEPARRRRRSSASSREPLPMFFTFTSVDSAACQMDPTTSYGVLSCGDY